MILLDALGTCLTMMIEKFTLVFESNLPRVMMGVDLEWDDAQRIEGRWVHDGHVVRGLHRRASDVGSSTCTAGASLSTRSRIRWMMPAR